MQDSVKSGDNAHPKKRGWHRTCTHTQDALVNMPVVEFTHGAGRVKVRNGCVVTYYGVITAVSFSYLRAMVIAATHGARSLFFDMSAVVDTSTLVPRIPDGSRPYTQAPGVIVCREDQMVIWRGYADKLAEQGVIRVLFLPAQLPLALCCVEAMHYGHPQYTESSQQRLAPVVRGHQVTNRTSG